MSADRDLGAAPAARQIGAGAVLLAVVVLFFGYVVAESGESDVVGWIIASLIAAAVAAGLFLWLIPRTASAPASSNQPATAGLVCGVIGFLAIIVYWLGLPYVVGAAAVVLGRMGQARAPQAGNAGLATAAVVLGALAVVLGVVVAVVDIAS